MGNYKQINAFEYIQSIELKWKIWAREYHCGTPFYSEISRESVSLTVGREVASL